jgi:hypothetical protein
MNEFTALETIYAPDTAVAGYQRGHEVPAAVVDAWQLTVGTQVCEGDLDPDAPAGPAMTRPGPEANRATWETWAVVNGMSAEDAATAGQDDLEAVEPEAATDRPADSAKKADWAAYVVSQGADEDWANASGRTKADLQSWEPEVGDPVAVSASEALNG